MGDYQRSIEVSAPAEQLFGYLSDVRNLPRYFSAMTSAEPAGGESVAVSATVNGTDERGEAWLRVDRRQQRLEWGSEGPGNYHGRLVVAGDATTSSVTVFIHTEDVDSATVSLGLDDTLAAVKRLVERGPAPGA